MSAYRSAAQIDPAALASPAAPERRQSSFDEQIRATCERFGAAWSAGDVGRLAALLASDCDHMALAGDRQDRCGRAELIARWTAAFARRRPDFSVRMRPALTGVRRLADGLAVLDGRLEYTSGIGAGGVLQGRLTQPFSALVTRTGDDWLILSIRVGMAARAAAIIAEA
ncbi:MAG TPA: nuclear transport factor 2 family protein [Vicinamibacterales bacterium]|nr:nuclear transport factor 2 family protein [Vicinamibacterales bacterium]